MMVNINTTKGFPLRGGTKEGGPPHAQNFENPPSVGSPPTPPTFVLH